MKIMFVMLASVAAGTQALTPQARPSEIAAMNDATNVIAVDRTGFAVSSLDEANRFWTGALGFKLERQSEMGGAISSIRLQVSMNPMSKRRSLRHRTACGRTFAILETTPKRGVAQQSGCDRSGSPSFDSERYSCCHCPGWGSRMEG